jgi:predicted nuclease of predicted toxin-antitoxin system
MQNTLFKILIDNNLSVLVKEVLKVNFPNSRHVSELQMSGASDSDIWQYAKEKDYIILTKDKDFYHRISVFGPPPKIVWKTKGNCRNKEMLQLLRDYLSVIKSFAATKEGLLIIT